MLADRLGLSQANLQTAIARLKRQGLEIEVQDQSEIRLPYSVELLSVERIAAGWHEYECNSVKQLDILGETDSTNQVLLDRARHSSVHRHVCLAEFQTAGRGRHGRRWIMPIGVGLCMSLGWTFTGSTKSIGTIGLVVAIGITRVLARLGARNLGIKWPNDILCCGRKLAGILVETRIMANRGVQIIVGTGINVSLRTRTIAGVMLPCTDVRRVVGYDVSRNALASALIPELFGVLETFQVHGFRAFEEEWRQHDLIAGKMVELSRLGTPIIGQAQGVDPQGALVVRVDNSIYRFGSAELTLSIRD